MFAHIDVTHDLETAALIALLRRGDRLWHHYAVLAEMAGSAIAVLRGEFEEPGDPQPRLFETAEPEPDLETIVNDIEAWRTEGMSIVTILDDAYPSNLRTIHNRPPLLFVRGRLIPEDDRSIAVVGTRKPTSSGLSSAASVAEGLVTAGYTVVSGLASGIDTRAHESTLEAGGRTVAVIGTGLRKTYPRENASLQERLSREAAVVSQFWPDAPPTRTSFPMRNVVMSGFALATVVIEASGESGARMQARFALEHNRPVFLLESLLEHPWARDYANRPGTYVVASADEIVSIVGRLNTLEALSVSS